MPRVIKRKIKDNMIVEGFDMDKNNKHIWQVLALDELETEEAEKFLSGEYSSIPEALSSVWANKKLTISQKILITYCMGMFVTEEEHAKERQYELDGGVDNAYQ